MNRNRNLPRNQGLQNLGNKHNILPRSNYEALVPRTLSFPASYPNSIDFTWWLMGLENHVRDVPDSMLHNCTKGVVQLATTVQPRKRQKSTHNTSPCLGNQNPWFYNILCNLLLPSSPNIPAS